MTEICERLGKQVDSALRRAAVVALGELGRSGDFRDRANAGCGLAAFAEMEEAVGPLLELVLDHENTFVTRVTVQALLRRIDRAGLRIGPGGGGRSWQSRRFLLYKVSARQRRVAGHGRARSKP